MSKDYPFLDGPVYPFTTSQITLDKEKVGMTQVLPSGVMNPKFDMQPDAIYDGMVARLTAYVLSEHLAADTVEESKDVPASWWDHLKYDLRRWADNVPRRSPAGKPRLALRCDIATLVRWWMRRHPPKLRTLTLTATWTRKATRPESKIAVDDRRLGPVVYQEQISHRLKWDR